MRKTVWLLLVLVLMLVGCSKPANAVVETPSAEAPNPKGYMEEPQILISSAHKYKDESWLSEDVDLKTDITLQGSSFFATIIFKGSISEEKLREAITLEGFEGAPEINIIPSEGKTVFYAGYRDVKPNEAYKLVVSKALADSEGKTLKSDIQKEITLRPDAAVSYTFYGPDGGQKGLGVNTIIDPYAVGSMNLNSDPKKFLAEFSAEVDKASVEKSIKDGFTDENINISFNWKDAKSLEIELRGFKSGEDRPYAISMNGAKDINGGKVYGNLFFTAGSANELRLIDLKSKSDSLLKGFAGKRYMAVQNPKINYTILLDDTETKYVLNMTAKGISSIKADREYMLGIPGLSYIYTWKDSNTILMMHRNTGAIMSYSTLEGSSRKLFTLPIDMTKNQVFDISASPDGNKLAVAYETVNFNVNGLNQDSFHLSIFDLTSSNAYDFDDVFKPRLMEIFGATADIQWLDNETLVLEDNISTENQPDYNVISININTGRKSVIAEHAFMPAVLTGKDIIKVESFKDFNSGKRSIDIIKSGKKIESFGADPFQYDNFFFSDENTLVYNQDDKIFAYYIDKDRSEHVADGFIIGLSADGSRVYYMTNYKMLYYID